MNQHPTKWDSPAIDPEVIGAISRVLKKFDVKDESSLRFVLTVLTDLGLFWEPAPDRKTEARTIRRRAKAATSERAQQEVLSELYQTVRGGRAIPVGVYARRRPEIELTRAIQLLDYDFEKALKMSASWRWRCIAEILAIVKGVDDTTEQYLSSSADQVRKRLERAQPLDDEDYEIALWYAEKKYSHENRTAFNPTI